MNEWQNLHLLFMNEWSSSTMEEMLIISDSSLAYLNLALQVTVCIFYQCHDCMCISIKYSFVR